MSSTKKTAADQAAPKKTATKKTAKKAAPHGEPPMVAFANPSAWSDWLAKNHGSSRGLWLKIAKNGSGVASVTYAEALDVALAWGWIDGQKGSYDDSAWLQRFTPRRPQSIWSAINREKALRLIAEGKMQPSGLAEVERAQQDGRWEAAYDSQSKATVPEDLAAALAKNKKAKAFFETLNSANRYAVLFRVRTAKKAETRARRIAQLVEMLARGEKLHP
jgi:uncharacterized protein YdeI (YjbR/CyaY-like superfamily)